MGQRLKDFILLIFKNKIILDYNFLVFCRRICRISWLRSKGVNPALYWMRLGQV
jgi:hypothetical protein